MSNAMKVVSELAEGMGLDELVFKDNVATIRFDDMILNFYVDPNSDLLSLFLRLGDVPTDQTMRLAVYAMLLKANNFGRNTGGAILGIDAEESSIFINHTFSLEHGGVAFLEKLVEVFLNIGERFINDLQALSSQPSQKGENTDNTPRGAMRV